MHPQYEKLTVLSIDGLHYLCECACGNIVILTQEELIKQGCGAACAISRGEVCAADIFNELGVKYQVQKKFEDFDMRFDFFYLITISLLNVTALNISAVSIVNEILILNYKKLELETPPNKNIAKNITLN